MDCGVRTICLPPSSFRLPPSAFVIQEQPVEAAIGKRFGQARLDQPHKPRAIWPYPIEDATRQPQRSSMEIGHGTGATTQTQAEQ